MVTRRRIERWGPPVLAALVAFALTATRLLPGVAFWDTAELQVVAPVLGTAHPTGFPTYVILGWLASVVLQPFGDAALRMNLFSAISVAVAVGVTVDVVRVLTGSRWIGFVTGLGLAITPLAWSIGTHAEAHSLHLALVAILLRVLVGWEMRRRPERGDGPRRGADRWLVWAAIVFALSVGNHSLTLLLAPPIALYVLAVEPGIVRRPWLVFQCAAALVITLIVVYLELPLRAGPFRAPLVYGEPNTLDGFLYIVLAEQFRGSVIDPFGDLPRKLRELVDLTANEFGLLAPLIPLGLVATVARRPRYALLSVTAMAITVFFAASYDNAAIERYYLGPALLAWTWLGLLAAAIAGGLRRLYEGPEGGRPQLQVAGVAALPGIVVGAVVAGLLLGPAVPELGARAAAADRSRETIAGRWLDEVVEVLEPNAVVVSWWSYSTTLWYGQHVEGRLPGVAIVDDRTRLDEDLGEPTDVVNRYLGRRPVYVIRNTDWAEIEEEFVIEMIPLPMPRSLARVVGRVEDRP